MKKRPKHYREQIYDYVESLIDRPLTFEEHDILRDLIMDYVFTVSNLRAIVARMVCIHDWKADKRIEGGDKVRLFVKCVKCDKRTLKKMPMHSARVFND